MIAALVVVFREVLEAGLIIGIVLAASRGVPGRNRAVALGLAGGIAGAVLVAAFTAQISSAFEGRGQELFTATVLLLAVLMLAWHVVWMTQHAKEMTARLREIGQDVAHGSRSTVALTVVVAMAVMREGSEVALFLASLVLQQTESALSLALGSLGGVALGAAVSAVIYFGLAFIPLKRVFSMTGALVTLLAAGLAAQAVHQLSNAGVLNLLDRELWDTTWLLSEDSWTGRVLHVLVGYMDRPSMLQALVYVATVVAISALSARQRPDSPIRQ